MARFSDPRDAIEYMLKVEKMTRSELARKAEVNRTTLIRISNGSTTDAQPLVRRRLEQLAIKAYAAKRRRKRGKK